jgi:hypothetical protein
VTGDGTSSAADGPDRTMLPSGTVTFLFTDIEGSTNLLRETGAPYEPHAPRCSSPGPSRASAEDG